MTPFDTARLRYEQNALLKEDGLASLNAHPGKVPHPLNEWFAINVKEAVEESLGHDPGLTGYQFLPIGIEVHCWLLSKVAFDKVQFFNEFRRLARRPFAITIGMVHQHRTPARKAPVFNFRENGLPKKSEVSVVADLDTFEFTVVIKHTKIESHSIILPHNSAFARFNEGEQRIIEFAGDRDSKDKLHFVVDGLERQQPDLIRRTQPGDVLYQKHPIEYFRVGHCAARNLMAGVSHFH